MRILRLVPLVLVLLVATLSDCLAKDMPFEVPPGWQRVRQGKRVLLHPIQCKTEDVEIVIFRADSLDNDDDAAGELEEALEDLHARKKVLEQRHFTRRKANGQERIETTCQLQDRRDKDKREFRRYCMARVGSRIQLVMYRASSRAFFDGHEKEFEWFLERWTSPVRN